MLFCSGLQEAYHRTHDVMDPTSANTNPGAKLQSRITSPTALYCIVSVMLLCCTLGSSSVCCFSSEQGQSCKLTMLRLCYIQGKWRFLCCFLSCC